ncbi:tape measure protein [Pseudomonas sp. NBRC 100443]|uniref:tape measure protein n=1 Tax=Pseudomonas sp. NBRC 100443 TaxID=1113665 RepID=UPI0024A1D05F|nr:tape measure protein [Pseudomonas sp. NBRC 100443]GLU42306.1 hypothetical protein Pssp01_63990 [Pseudomonas sp. NBRC 100443]
MANPVQRLIQFVLRGKDEMSPAAKQSAEALEALRSKASQLGEALDNAKSARGLISALSSTQRAVSVTETSVNRAEKYVNDLREALNKEPGNKGLEVALKAAEKDAATLRRTLDALNAKLADQQQAARAAGIDTDKLADEERRLAAEVTRTKEAISQNAKELRDLERAQARARREAENHVSRVDALRSAMSAGVRQAVGYAAAFVGINAAFGLIGRGVGAVRDGIVSMLKTGDEFEGLQTRLTSLMGSVEKGQEAAAWITKFAKDTPLQLQEVTDAFALLKAYGIDPMDGTFKALEDQSEKLGGGMERLEGIATAVGQAWAKQKLQTEEILQLVERGVPVWDMLSNVTGKNVEQLQELASKGKLGRDVIKALIDEMGRTSGGAAAANMSRLSGLISNLQDTATNFLNRIANAGALDYVKGKLQALADTIAQMDADGRLDKLAEGLSDAFVQGAEWVGDFIKRLGEVDFKALVDNTSTWLSGFRSEIDEMATRVQLFIAPFRTLFNGITSGLSTLGLTWASTMGLMVSGIEKIAAKIPDALGGEKIRASVAGVQNILTGLSATFKAQIEQDAKDIAAAWDTSTKDTASAAGEQSQVITEHFENLKTDAQDASTQSVQSINSLQEALDSISSATTAAQLKRLQDLMLKAYQEGRISQQEYANGAGVLNSRLKELQKSAGGAALGVSDLSTGLESLKDVQAAISNAKTAADIQNIRTAITKLYNDGKIGADQYNQSMADLSAKQQELKASTGQLSSTMDTQAESTKGLTRSQQMMNEAMEDGIVTTEELRRISGERMEEERKGVQATKDNIAETSADMSDFAGFYEGVINQARQPLAELGKEALAAFDQLRGISTTDISIDTSSLESTTKALQQMRSELDRVQGAASMPGLSGLGRWALSMQEESKRVAVSFLEQKQQLLSLMDSYEKKTIPLSDFVDKAKAARNSMNLLNDSDLRQLESAIDSAKQRMDQLESGTRDTLTGLKEELAGLRGETEAVDRSKFNSRRQDLQQQLAEAQASGNLNAVQNIMEALATLQQIQAETDAKRQLAEQQARVDAQNAAQAQAPAPAAAAPAAAAPSQPMKTIRLEVQGRSVDVGVTDDGSQLLDLLGKAALRTS